MAHALKLIDEGADLIDLGAESTRPGSHAGGAAGSAQAPAVGAKKNRPACCRCWKGVLSARPDAVISVDTYKASTARAALESGAEIVNDVSGFSWDAEMAAVCAESGAGVVLMHTRGRPEEWRRSPNLSPMIYWRLCVRAWPAVLQSHRAQESRPKPLSSIPAMDLASASTRTTLCWLARPSCSHWAARCWPASAGSRFLGHTLAAL